MNNNNSCHTILHRESPIKYRMILLPATPTKFNHKFTCLTPVKDLSLLSLSGDLSTAHHKGIHTGFTRLDYDPPLEEFVTNVKAAALKYSREKLNHDGVFKTKINLTDQLMKQTAEPIQPAKPDNEPVKLKRFDLRDFCQAQLNATKLSIKSHTCEHKKQIVVKLKNKS